MYNMSQTQSAHLHVPLGNLGDLTGVYKPIRQLLGQSQGWPGI